MRTLRLDEIEGIPVLGTSDNLENVIREKGITQVILLEFPLFAEVNWGIIRVCDQLGIRLLIVSFDAELRRTNFRRMPSFLKRELERRRNQILLLNKSASERVASFLIEIAERCQSCDEIELSMSRQDVGDYLGLTSETVSRMLTRFET